MSDAQQRELALAMLRNLESWIKHSDQPVMRLFPEQEEMDGALALCVVGWIKEQVEQSSIRTYRFDEEEDEPEQEE